MIAWVACAGALAVIVVLAMFRRDLALATEAALAGSTVLPTACGSIEYMGAGSGRPLLVVHGSGGGFDQGMAFARPLLARGFRLVAPSRFGYLGTPMPADASPAAQADAHACLLDALGIDGVDVLGVSAGAASALELALRHPARVRSLALVVPIAWHPGLARETARPRSAAADRWLMRLLGSDFAYWLALRLAPDRVVAFVLATPPQAVARAEPSERERIAGLAQAVLPLSRRAPGLRADTQLGRRLGPAPLERVRAPTLVVSARDDGFGTFAAAEHLAAGIAGARLLAFASGGTPAGWPLRGDPRRDRRARGFRSRQRRCAARRVGQQGTVAEGHDHVGPAAGQAGQRGEVVAQRRHFGGLVDEGGAQAERAGHQPEALAGGARQRPVRRVVALGEEHRDAGGAVEVARILVGFRIDGEHALEEPPADRIGQGRVAAARAVQAVATGQRRARTEADPVAQFRHEGRVAHLDAVAFDHQVAHAVDLAAFGEHDRRNARSLRGVEQPSDVDRGHAATVVDAARGLPQRNRVEQDRRLRRTGRMREAQRAAVRVDMRHRAMPAGGRRRDPQVLGRAAEAGPQMVIVGIDHRRAAGEVGQQGDRIRFDPEAPRLGVVAVGGERGEAQPFGRPRGGIEGTAQGLHGLGVVAARASACPPGEGAGRRGR
jgi:pimeloyl-ACP methyl ester carboxylesterase